MKAPPISFKAAFPAFFSPGGEGSPRKDDGAMTLFARLLQAVRSWRRRRGGPKTVRYAGISMEQLDHRQLLSVNFTGNVVTDFPASTVPGVVVLPDNPLVQHPTIAPAIAPIVKVSGFDISGIRVTYTAADDTLSIGLDQPQSGNHPGEVIAGDADNNGNSGTVNPAVLAVPGFAGFQDLPDFGGTEHMGAFLDFTGSGNAQVVAGFTPVPPSGEAAKPYQVALAIPTGPNSAPIFGTELPQYEGNVYYNNSIAHPNLEFAISHFSQLYQTITGHALTSTSVFNIGAFGGSGQDVGISEAFFPEQPVTLSAATLPPVVCPPISPPILINPHEHRVIDTDHRDLVRVYILGTSGFDVTQINPATVSLDGARPIAHTTRHFPHDEFLNAVYTFVGKDINLPPGYTTATFTAMTFSGQQITTSKQVLNIPFSARVPGRLHFLSDKGSVYPGLGRLNAREPGSVTLGNTTQPIPLIQSQSASPAIAVTSALQAAVPTVKVPMVRAQAAKTVRVNYKAQVSASGTTTPVVTPRHVVSIARGPAPTNGSHGAKISGKLASSLNSFLGQGGL